MDVRYRLAISGVEMKESGMTALVSITLWASFIFAQQQKPQWHPWPQWKEYVYAEDGFAITLPEDPHPHPDASLADTTVYTVVVPPQGNLSLRVLRQERDCAATLDGGLKGKAGIDPLSVKEVSVAGHPGLESMDKLGSVLLREWQVLHVFDWLAEDSAATFGSNADRQFFPTAEDGNS